MSSQRALIPLRFTDTEHWEKTSGTNKTSNWKKGYGANAMLSDLWEFIHAVREKGN